MRIVKALVALVIISVLGVASTAMAATVDIKPTITTFTDLIIQSASIVFTALLGVFVHGETEAKLRTALQSALDAAADYAHGKIESSDWTNITVKNQLTAIAVGYVQKSVPKALKWFNINEERLAQLVLARLVKQRPYTIIESVPAQLVESAG